MLKRVKIKTVDVKDVRFAIVASNFNKKYVDSMVESALEVFKKNGINDVTVVRVPGSFEIPVVAAKLAESKNPRFSAIICFGVIFRGETTHAQHIGEAISHALANLQITSKTVVLHGVYLFENQDQAKVRCLNKEFNRGIELAQTAMEMANVIKRVERIITRQ
jgi:6,7-dimethyl-8-ribityllumazine synthase